MDAGDHSRLAPISFVGAGVGFGTGGFGVGGAGASPALLCALCAGDCVPDVPAFATGTCERPVAGSPFGTGAGDGAAARRGSMAGGDVGERFASGCIIAAGDDEVTAGGAFTAGGDGAAIDGWLATGGDDVTPGGASTPGGDGAVVDGSLVTGPGIAPAAAAAVLPVPSVSPAAGGVRTAAGTSPWTGARAGAPEPPPLVSTTTATAATAAAPAIAAQGSRERRGVRLGIELADEPSVVGVVSVIMIGKLGLTAGARSMPAIPAAVSAARAVPNGTSAAASWPTSANRRPGSFSRQRATTRSNSGERRAAAASDPSRPGASAR